MEEDNSGSPQDEVDSPPNTNRQGMTRRSFLQGTAAALGFTLLNRRGIKTLEGLTQPVPENQEREKREDVLIIDFPAETLETVGQNLGSLSSDERELVEQVLDEKRDHAGLVSKTYEQIYREIGGTGSLPEVVSARDAVKWQNLTSSPDNPLKNPKFGMELDEIALGNIIQNRPEKIINLSSQVGLATRERVLHAPRDINYEIITDDEGKTFWAITEGNEIEGHQALQGVGFVPFYVKDGQRVNAEVLGSEEAFNERNIGFKEKSIQEYVENGTSPGIVEAMHTETIEAYNDKLARENLDRLVKLCERFPDRLFVAAGGNEGNFFFQARKELTERYEREGKKWPENLVLVGVRQTNPRDLNNVEADGCDIYLDKDDYQQINGGGYLSSSEATPIVAAVAEAIARKYNLTDPKSIKEKLLSDEFSVADHYVGKRTEGEEGDREYPSRDCRLLKPDLYKRAFGVS